MAYHFPVLSQEVLDILAPTSDKTFIDATLGNGGHTLLLLQAGARVFGLDQDPSNLAIAQSRIDQAGLSSQFIGINCNFSQLSQIWKDQINTPIDGILFDLGLSSNQQTAQNRGFSFNDEQSLDMRLDPVSQELTAEYVINVYPFDELYQMFTRYAQEVYAKPIILRIIRERQKSPIKTAKRLADIIRDYYQKAKIKTNIDPATKILMALRIFINDEFKNLKSVLTQTLEFKGTTIAIISFHSGEDRLVKQFVRDSLRNNLIDSSNKAISPTSEEISQNPLSRSAILRSYKIR